MKTIISFIGLLFLIGSICFVSAEDDLREGWYKLRLHTKDFNLKDSTTSKSCDGIPGDKFFITKRDDTSSPPIYELYFYSLEDENNCLNEDVLYTIHQEKLTQTQWTRRRISHGVLVVPFKLRNDDKSLSGESTLGYYVGLEWTWLQASSNLVLAAGLSLIPIPKTSTDGTDGTVETDEKTGVTGAVGWIFKTLDNFQVGAFIGADHLGGEDGKNWQYEDDPWISISIGYDFSK